MSDGNDDTGARLRSLYTPEGGVGAVFSGKVAHYVASRPAYPDALFDRLAQLGVLPPNAAVADIGAGTGLLTRSLLERGHTVVAVEPNDPMRAAADAVLASSQPRYRSVAGTAEATTLAPDSVDLVTAAQAFHWFDIEPARREMLRILRAHGQVALIWNDRVPDDPLHVALDGLFAEFGGEKRGALVAHEDRSQVPVFFGAAPAHRLDLPNEQGLSRDGLASLVFSRSYMPAADSTAGQAVHRRVDEIFTRHAGEGDRVVVRYRCIAHVGRPRA
jgi:SAM-dependent methyltransferase